MSQTVRQQKDEQTGNEISRLRAVNAEQTVALENLSRWAAVVSDANHAELDKARATVAKLRAALLGMVEIIDHLREYPACNPRKFIFCRDNSEHGNIVDARALLAKLLSDQT